MKLNKYIVATALAMCLAGAANAQTVYVTGSTAFRSQFALAMNTSGVVFSPAPTETTWSGNGSTYMAFTGTGTTTVNGGAALTVLCSWSGSEAGIKDVSPVGSTESFPSAPYPGGTVSGSASTFLHDVDIAMADTDTPFSRVYGANPTPPAPITSKHEVGVVTFKWVRNPGLWTGTNVSDLMIRQALNSGAYRSVFSGNSGDTKDFVYVAGRDNSSGTRANAFGECAWGIFNPPGQIELSSGQMVEVGGSYCGDFGQSSGGTLAATMGASTTGSTDLQNGGTGFSVIAYLGASDAATALTDGATELTYNGVLFSVSAIEGGSYSFWGNEYIMMNNAAVAPATGVYTALAATSGIAAAIPSPATGAAAAIRLSDMLCTRTGPLGDPIHD